MKTPFAWRYYLLSPAQCSLPCQKHRRRLSHYTHGWCATSRGAPGHRRKRLSGPLQPLEFSTDARTLPDTRHQSCRHTGCFTHQPVEISKVPVTFSDGRSTTAGAWLAMPTQTASSFYITARSFMSNI